jgi:hypothetical protein
MKRFEKKGAPPVGTRSGPRARAAQERRFSDPYQHAERPARFVPRDQARSAVVTLDPDVARVFRNSEAVNEALRLVMRLARFAGGGGNFQRDRPRPPAEGRFTRDQPRGRSPAPGGRFSRDQPQNRPPTRRDRKFDDD